MDRNPAANAGNMDSVSGLGRSHVPGSNEAHVPQLPSPHTPKPVLCNKRSHCSEKPMHRNKENPLTATTESPRAAMKTQPSQQ